MIAQAEDRFSAAEKTAPVRGQKSDCAANQVAVLCISDEMKCTLFYSAWPQSSELHLYLYTSIYNTDRHWDNCSLARIRIHHFRLLYAKLHRSVIVFGNFRVQRFPANHRARFIAYQNLIIIVSRIDRFDHYVVFSFLHFICSCISITNAQPLNRSHRQSLFVLLGGTRAEVT